MLLYLYHFLHLILHYSLLLLSLLLLPDSFFLLNYYLRKHLHSYFLILFVHFLFHLIYSVVYDIITVSKFSRYLLCPFLGSIYLLKFIFVLPRKLYSLSISCDVNFDISSSLIPFFTFPYTE